MLELLRSFIRINLPTAYFVYGLFFFASGLGIIVQHRKIYPFRFAKDLWLMGIFGLLHAASEWSYLFIPFQASYLGPHSIFLLNLLHQLIEAVSFMTLFFFSLCILDRGRIRRLAIIPVGIFIVWCGIVGASFLRKLPIEETLSYAGAYSHYLLFFPASLLTAIGLYRLGERLGTPKLSRNMLSSIKALSFVFLFYAVFTGLIVDPAPFFPANWVNSSVFNRLTHVPVQFFRGLAGSAMMIETLKLLHELNTETDLMLAQAEEEAMRFSERERIGRDLHDGVIQTLYATGLMLEASVRELGTQSPLYDQLSTCIKNLNTSLLDLRLYITGLKNEDISHQPLKTLLESLLEEIHRNYNLQVELRFLADSLLQLSPNRQNHLYHVVKELLNNIAKHTSASKVQFELVEESTALRLSLWDNGQAQDTSLQQYKDSFGKLSGIGSGMGWNNICERLAILRGEIHVSHPETGGTLVTLRIPQEVFY